MKKYHFISGLPRSGSTLLSAILKQNPNFHADISSPVLGCFKDVLSCLSATEASPNIKDYQRVNSLAGFLNGFYQHVKKDVIFDTSREWTANTNLIKTLFPNAKIICCVRDIAWILDSFERIKALNPLHTNSFVSEKAVQSVETRCLSMMDPQESGQVYKPLKWLEEGLSANPDMILLVEYDSLCKTPRIVLQQIYEFLNEKPYQHDFNSVEYNNTNFDILCGTPDLHTVRKKVSWVERKTILPKSVWEKYQGLEFWREKQAIYE